MTIQFKLRNLIGLLVVSSILVCVAAVGWIVYGRLHRTILEGFDKKLSAVSTVTAAFIDAQTHERLLAPRMIEALAVDPADGSIYGADSSFGETTLVSIDPETGGAEAVTPLTELPVSFTFLPGTESIFGIVGPDLVEIDRATGAITHRFALPTQSRALAISPGGQLYAGGAGLHVIDLESGAATALDTAAGLRIDEMTFAGESELVIFDAETLTLFKFDLATGETAAAKTPPSALIDPDTPKIRGLATDLDSRRVLAATDRLLWLDPVTLETTASETTAGFRSENGPDYLNYAKSLRAIKAREELTFLYTQTLSDGDEVCFDGSERRRMDNNEVRRIVYVLDANTLEDDGSHTPIGTVDEDEADEATRDVFFKGTLHLSDIVFWDRWGLLKSAHVPIYDDEVGKIVGMAGADVNVQTIREKTKIALAKVTLTGVGALLIATLVSIFVARKLTEPIDRLKDVALKTAAGLYGEQIEPAKLLELARLSETFNRMSETLRETVTGLEETNRQWEADRRHYELIRYLTLRNADLDAYGAWVELVVSSPAHLNPSGWTNWNRFVVGWVAPAAGDPLENLRFRAATTALFLQVLESSQGDWESIRQVAESLFAESLITLFFVDLAEKRAEFAVWGEPVLWRLEPGEEPRTEALVDGQVQFGADIQYVVCARESLAKDMSLWARNPGADLISTFKLELDGMDRPESGISINLKGEKESNR